MNDYKALYRHHINYRPKQITKIWRKSHPFTTTLKLVKFSDVTCLLIEVIMSRAKVKHENETVDR